MSIKSFLNQATLDIYEGNETKKVRSVLPEKLRDKARRRLDRLEKAEHVEEVRQTPGYSLKKLPGERDGQLSIRINDQYRICFYWFDDDAHAVEITDYHD